LVPVLDQQGVGKIDAAGLDLNHDLAFSGLGVCHLLDNQFLGGTVVGAKGGFHG
jgi:hypothetical protein